MDLNKKLKYRFTNFHDQTYFGIRDIEKLYEYFNDDNEPMLIASSFDNNYTEYKIRGEKNKDLSLKEYIFKITPQLIDLINEKMNSTKDEQKIQLIIAIVFKHTTDPTKNYTFYVRSKNILMLQADDANDILDKLLNSFFENYENKQNIQRNGSNYVFDYVDI